MRLGLSQGLSTGGFVPSGVAAISNSKSLDFDGSNDRLTFVTPSAFSGESLDNFNCTLSCWVKFDSITQYGAIISLGPADCSISPLMSGSDVGIWLQDTALTSAGTHDPSTGTWYHYVATKSGTTYKFYANGSLLGTATDTDSATIGAESYIGNNGFGSYLNGNVDEIAVWNSTLSDDEIAALYNNGTPTDLSKDGGGYTSSSGLQLWYRMGDATSPATDGTGSHTNKLHILDQANTTLGSELVIADAYVAAEWYDYAGNTLTFGDNYMRCERTASGDSNGWFTYLRTSASQNSILTSTPTTGSFYLLTFDVDTDDADAYVYMKFGNVASTILSGTGNGTKTVVYKKGSSSHNDYLEGRNLSQGKFMKISNVSVKKIMGVTAEMTNMDSSDIETESP